MKIALILPLKIHNLNTFHRFWIKNLDDNTESWKIQFSIWWGFFLFRKGLEFNAICLKHHTLHKFDDQKDIRMVVFEPIYLAFEILPSNHRRLKFTSTLLPLWLLLNISNFYSKVIHYAIILLIMAMMAFHWCTIQD